MTTLTPLVYEYLRGRRLRGEITVQTQQDLTYTLAGLDRSFGNRPLRQFGPKAIDRWMETIGDRADATRREYLSRVRTFSRWLVAQGHIGGDPTSHVPKIVQPRQVVVTFTDRQKRALFKSVADDARALAILALLFDCGCRCVEVSRLRVEDYDADNRTIKLIGKARHERDVPVPTSAAQFIDAYLDTVTRQAGPLIRSREVPTQGLAAKTISHYFRGWAKAAGVKTQALDGRSAHGARRTCLSNVQDASGDIRVTQGVAGHARIETTAKSYLRPVSLDAMRAAMEAGAKAAPVVTLVPDERSPRRAGSGTGGALGSTVSDAA